MLECSRVDARRFVLRKAGLAEPVASVGASLERMGYVQMDPLNVCGRMHDLILRNRVAGYRENDLLRYLYPDGTAAPGDRRAFEHYLPEGGVIVALPLDAWPYLLERQYARRSLPGFYSGQLSAPEEQLARRILAELAERGPLTSDQIEHDARASTAWGSRARMAKTVLEKLFVHGRVLISRRENFRRVYDLPERVLPGEVLAKPQPAPEDTRRWHLELRLRQRRLVRFTKIELPHIEHRVTAVRIDRLSPVYCLREDAADLEAAADERPASPAAPPKLLAPLDPLIYDRQLTRRLWDFDYTWEVYTPAAKRKRGYYALPVLAGAEIVGHVDPKADRKARKLRIVSRRVRRGCAVSDAVRALAHFLGCRP